MTTTQLEPVILSTSYFARTVSTLAGVSDSLKLSKAVDDAITAIEHRRDIFGTLAQLGNALAASLQATKLEAAFDPEDNLIADLDRAQEATRQMISVSVQRDASVDSDSKLSSEQRAYLHCAYKESLAAVSQLDQALDKMKDAIICHDLEHDAPTGPFTDPEKLIASLRASH